jgi:hypothetical protein
MASKYHIRREAILAALGLKATIPVGFTAEYENVRVTTGPWSQAWGPCPEHRTPNGFVVLPQVRVVARGVANRVQATCPKCGKWMRFCGLQQHVDTKVCRRLAARHAKQAIRPETLEQIRDRKIATAERHGWGIAQWSCDGTKAQMIRGRDDLGILFTIEIGLGVARRFPAMFYPSL